LGDITIDDVISTIHRWVRGTTLKGSAIWCNYGAGHLVTATFGQPPIWPRKKKKNTKHFIGQEIQLSISELKILISIFIMTPQKKLVRTANGGR